MGTLDEMEKFETDLPVITVIINHGYYKTYEKFSVWAFGENYEELSDSLEIMHAWNKLHGDILMLNEANNIKEDIQKMVHLYYQKES